MAIFDDHLPGSLLKALSYLEALLAVITSCLFTEYTPLFNNVQKPKVLHSMIQLYLNYFEEDDYDDVFVVSSNLKDGNSKSCVCVCV